MSADAPVPAPLSRFRRWLRRGIGVLAMLLVAIGIFHRPIGHAALRYFGNRALAKAGISGDWTTSGSLLGDVEVGNVRLIGNDASPLRSLRLDHAAVDYDLREIWHAGPGTMMKRLVIRNLDAEIDLTRPPSLRPTTARATARAVPKFPGIRLPEVRLEHLTLRIKRSGQDISVRDFSLILDPARPGMVRASAIQLPGVPPFTEVRGVTHLGPTTLTLENTSLWEDGVLEHLVIDLARLSSNDASISLAARQIAARVELAARVSDWFSAPAVDAEMKATGISPDSLVPWGVPRGPLTWEGAQARLKIQGAVMRPDRLEGGLEMSVGSVAWMGRAISPLEVRAGMDRGAVTLQQLTARQGSNIAEAQGSASLPESWAAVGRSPGRLDFTLRAPDLSGLAPTTADVSGSADGHGSVTIAGGAITQATVQMVATALKVKGVPVESATVDAALAGDVLTVVRGEGRLNARNILTTTGELTLTGDKAFRVNWQVAAEDLATVPVEARATLPWPTAGKLLSDGTASGSLTALAGGRWESLDAEVSADAAGLRMGEAGLDSLRLRARSHRGVVAVPELSVRLDATNRLVARGEASLTDPTIPLNGEMTLSIPELARVSAWSAQFGGPALQGGAVEATWRGAGVLNPLQMESTGQINIRQVRLVAATQPLGLQADLRQSGTEIELRNFQASAGPWRVAGGAAWNGSTLVLPALEGWWNETRLIQLSASLPFVPGGPQRMPPDAPVSLTFKAQRMDLSRLAGALGRALPVSGMIEAEGSFTGPLASLSGRVHAELTQLNPTRAIGPQRDPGSVVLHATLANRRLTLNGTATQRPLQPLTLSASIPLDAVALANDPGVAASLPLTGHLRLPPSPLATLPSYLPVLRAVDGTVTADGSISGTITRPVWQGNARVQAREASFHSPSLPTVRDVNLILQATEKRLMISAAEVMLAGGRLRLSGGAGLDNPTDPSLDLTLRADEVLVVRDDNLSLRANAALTCTGRWSKADVRGPIDLVRGRVFKEIEFLPLSLPNQLPPPPPPTTLRRQGPPALPPPFNNWTFEIPIHTRDPVRLMGNIARGDAVVDLHLAGTGAAPILTGAVSLADFWVKLPFSRLNITKGLLLFSKDNPFDPQIDLVGESITGGRMVQVFVQGRALDPTVRLASNPPLPEGEIAALLATGVTASDLASNRDEAAGRAAFFLLQQTYRKLFRKSAATFDDAEPPRVSFEFSIFGSDPSRRGVSAIYEINPNWRLSGRVNETGTFRGLLHYLIRFR